MTTKDLGTYHVRVEFNDGDGFIYQWATGGRYCRGTSSVSPLDAEPIAPGWPNEGELFSGMLYMFREGNYACDCNLRNFLDDAHQRERGESGCGDDLSGSMTRIVAIRPDAAEVVLWERGE